MSDDEREIRSLIETFAAAHAAGHLQGVLDCYSDDLVKLRNGSPAETKAVVAERIAQVFEKYHSKVDATVDEILVDGDLAVVRGNFTVSLTPKSGGDEQTFERRYLEVWRRAEGRWLVARTMDNVHFV